ncbi:MAG: cupin domain-containing protein [Armatimonadota bacterium]
MSTTTKPHIVRHIDDVPGVPCPCGTSARPLTREDTEVANLYVTHIQDSEKHYHERSTEIYFIIEGSGTMELEDEQFELRPGLMMYIPAGVAHRGWGDFRTVIVGIPALDPEDEVILEEQKQ